MKLDKLYEWVLQHSVTTLIRLACILALAGLFALCSIILWPKPLMVVVVMGVGHGIGVAAFGCYLLAVILDNRRQHREAVMRASLADGVKVPKAS